MIDVGDELIQGMANAVAHAKGRKAAVRRETVVAVRIPDRIDVVTIRRKVGMSQVTLAARYCFSVKTLRNWNRAAGSPRGRRAPTLS